MAAPASGRPSTSTTLPAMLPSVAAGTAVAWAPDHVKVAHNSAAKNARLGTAKYPVLKPRGFAGDDNLPYQQRRGWMKIHRLEL